jgi:hypothetical protein
LETASNDLYIGYNLAYAFHAGTQESANLATVVEQGNGPSESDKKKVLNAGNTHKVGQVTINVTETVTGGEEYAYVLVNKDKCDTCFYASGCTSECSVATCQAGSCTLGANDYSGTDSPSTSPTTSKPTTRPSQFSSNAPTTSLLPSTSQSKIPSALPTSTSPSTFPSNTPTTSPPSTSPSQSPTDAPVIPIVEINYENFEGGMGIWNLGINEESKLEAKYQDTLDCSVDSSTLTDIDVSSYTTVEIDYYFKSIQLGGDGFYLEAAADGSILS